MINLVILSEAKDPHCPETGMVRDEEEANSNGERNTRGEKYRRLKASV